MDAIEAVCGGLPASADRIRRRFWRDPEFRTVCEDYRDVSSAGQAGPVEDGYAGLAEEYRELAAELLAEAAAMLKGDRS